jgi:hypothetical protein
MEHFDNNFGFTSKNSSGHNMDIHPVVSFYLASVVMIVALVIAVKLISLCQKEKTVHFEDNIVEEDDNEEEPIAKDNNTEENKESITENNEEDDGQVQLHTNVTFFT